jgi:transcriptional regulator with XRE-family HTH domain
MSKDRLDNLTLARNLKFLRKRRGMTQKDMGDIIGKSREVYQTYESTKHEPSIGSMLAFSNHFGLSLDRLLKQELSSLDDPLMGLLEGGYDKKQWKQRLEKAKE